MLPDLYYFVWEPKKASLTKMTLKVLFGGQGLIDMRPQLDQLILVITFCVDMTHGNNRVPPNFGKNIQNVVKKSCSKLSKTNKKHLGITWSFL